jgi:thiosulfate reductase cytochrome b subunit
MEKNGGNRFSKAFRNYYLNLVTIVPFLLLILSGLVILRYHGGEAYETETIGISGHNWLKTHQILALIVVPLIIIHLWLHSYWIVRLFSFKQKSKAKNNDMTIALFAVFILTVLTALLSWLVFDGKPIADLLREVHNKLGFALIFFFVIHLVNYFKWLVNMTKKLLGRQ